MCNPNLIKQVVDGAVLIVRQQIHDAAGLNEVHEDGDRCVRSVHHIPKHTHHPSDMLANEICRYFASNLTLCIL